MAVSVESPSPRTSTMAIMELRTTVSLARISSRASIRLPLSNRLGGPEHRILTPLIRAPAGPDDSGGINKIPGDWHETMSTHWFHDHMFSFTSQNVYKGMAGMFNIYSALDRGNEALDDGVNLRLPSGTAKSWGNLEYDINLVLADKAWDQDGQLFFDIFDFDGFLGDVMTVNFFYKPFFEVERRKYRFRILNGAVSRFFKVAISDATNTEQSMIFIANDGNLMPSPVVLKELDEQGIAERYDIVFDFSKYNIGDKLWMVNLCEHEDGKKPSKDLTLADALSGKSADPCVGKFLEFRIVRNPATPDVSQVPATMIPNPDLSSIPVTRERVFEFGSGGNQTTNDPVSTFFGPWGIQTDNRGGVLNADSAASQQRPSSARAKSGPCRMEVADGTIRFTSILKKARSLPATAAQATCLHGRKAARTCIACVQAEASP